MQIPIEKLTYEQFELLCMRLFAANGLSPQQEDSRGRDLGLDFKVVDASNVTSVVEVKHLRKPRTSLSFVRNAAEELVRAAKANNAEHAILVLSMLLPQRVIDDVSQEVGIQLLDSRWIQANLQKYPQIEADFQAVLAVQEKLSTGLWQMDVADLHAKSLEVRLSQLSPGFENWREYENLCIEILNYLFLPPFKAPKIQSRSEDGLDRRDAVYPIANGSQFWNDIKQDFHTMFVVAEFKNLSSQAGQNEIESISQYLFKNARRAFGMLCCRHGPSSSALTARRRAWMQHESIIVIFSDSDLIDMLALKARGDAPEKVIEEQLESFFLALAP